VIILGGTDAKIPGGTDAKIPGGTDSKIPGGTDVSSPLLRVVRGTPDDYELAALAAVIATSRGNRPSDSTTDHPLWTYKGRPIGAAPSPGRGAWRASGLPSGYRP
jgi:hypothetical protein